MNTDIGNQENRIDSLDIFKGVLIFLVVLGHFLLPIKDGEYMFITKLFFSFTAFICRLLFLSQVMFTMIPGDERVPELGL